MGSGGRIQQACSNGMLFMNWGQRRSKCNIFTRYRLISIVAFADVSGCPDRTDCGRQPSCKILFNSLGISWQCHPTIIATLAVHLVRSSNRRAATARI